MKPYSGLHEKGSKERTIVYQEHVASWKTPGTFDSKEDGNITSGAWRQNQDNMSSLLPLRNILRKPRTEAKTIRDELAEYFMSNGRVTWQDLYC
ncbi:unnamed protein product [Acanthoscelides obtectus]|uniref:Uncharacterized protein n=1 Tax=Acanthoscelides obtectus TaxID=200917 RepID=A0A9P0KGA0_ACAOB|nr:unnamed protein product [Acanthoscelides obtectus]CAK1640918.1 hypothetical protein AOBTE_LOCUS12020 [Acanthoscelides obtectus]